MFVSLPSSNIDREQIFYGEFDGGRKKLVLVKILGCRKEYPQITQITLRGFHRNETRSTGRCEIS
jgi:hypothetical protein